LLTREDDIKAGWLIYGDPTSHMFILPNNHLYESVFDDWSIHGIYPNPNRLINLISSASSTSFSNPADVSWITDNCLDYLSKWAVLGISHVFTTSMDVTLRSLFQRSWRRAARIPLIISITENDNWAATVSFLDLKLRLPVLGRWDLRRESLERKEHVPVLMDIGERLWEMFQSWNRVDVLFYVCCRLRQTLIDMSGVDVAQDLLRFVVKETGRGPVNSRSCKIEEIGNPDSLIVYVVVAVPFDDSQTLLNSAKTCIDSDTNRNPDVGLTVGIGSILDRKFPFTAHVRDSRNEFCVDKLSMDTTDTYLDCLDPEEFAIAFNSDSFFHEYLEMDISERCGRQLPLSQRWVTYHNYVIDIFLAMEPLDLPPYVLLAIIDEIPSFAVFDHCKKIFLIIALRASTRRVVGERAAARQQKARHLVDSIRPFIE